jgi:hypothetical protein
VEDDTSLSGLRCRHARCAKKDEFGWADLDQKACERTDCPAAAVVLRSNKALEGTQRPHEQRRHYYIAGVDLLAEQDCSLVNVEQHCIGGLAGREPAGAGAATATNLG